MILRVRFEKVDLFNYMSRIKVDPMIYIVLYPRFDTT